MPISAAAMPGRITLGLPMVAAIWGINGGPKIVAVEVTKKASSSTLKILASKRCKQTVPIKVAMANNTT